MAEATSKTDDITDAAIDEAATAIDAANPTTNDESVDDKKEPRSMKGMLRLLRKHSDGTNVVKESITTFSNPDGSNKKGDMVVQDEIEGLASLKELVEADKVKNASKPKKVVKWEFGASPHEQFGKTLDDTFSAFVRWSKITSEDGSYNISKAFRRLASYAQWMEDVKKDLVEPALTADSVKVALDAWGMKCTIDKNGNFVWWVDFAKVDTVAVKTTIPPMDSLRAFVFYAHYVMYDPNAQENGVIFIETVNKIRFIQMVTLMPMKLGVKVDRLTIGVLPVRMKALYILDSPTWMDVFMKFMAVFMSKKMQERLVVLKDWDKVEEIVGTESIPKSFGQLEGFVEVDAFNAKYFSS